jgi:hypothetical protein
MGRNQTEFGEVGAKAVGEVAVEKNIANWGDGKPVHTDTRYEKASLLRTERVSPRERAKKSKRRMGRNCRWDTWPLRCMIRTILCVSVARYIPYFSFMYLRKGHLILMRLQ